MKIPVLRHIYPAFFIAGALMLLRLGVALAAPDSVLSAPEAAQTLAVQNVTVRDNVVSGEVVNMSPHQLRDVQLLIRRIWYWSNEFHPGQNPSGFADYYSVREEIAPGRTTRFSYTLPSGSQSESGGHFETVVTVAGFTTIEEKRNDGDRRPVS